MNRVRRLFDVSIESSLIKGGVQLKRYGSNSCVPYSSAPVGSVTSASDHWNVVIYNRLLWKYSAPCYRTAWRSLTFTIYGCIRHRYNDRTVGRRICLIDLDRNRFCTKYFSPLYRQRFSNSTVLPRGQKKTQSNRFDIDSTVR